uniref:Uncharacterized protein n=1 Tax=Fagus sylvatica TaxID=28930 RepID=A0A2N9ITN5_FAGSY
MVLKQVKSCAFDFSQFYGSRLHHRLLIEKDHSSADVVVVGSFHISPATSLDGIKDEAPCLGHNVLFPLFQDKDSPNLAGNVVVGVGVVVVSGNAVVTVVGAVVEVGAVVDIVKGPIGTMVVDVVKVPVWTIISKSPIRQSSVCFQFG